MLNRSIRLLIAVLSIAICAASNGRCEDDAYLQNWHQFRGPLANGYAPTAKPPVEWSEQQNVKWKSKIPGVGSSTPIVWQDKVFVLSARDTGRVDPSRTPPEKQQRRPFGITYPNTFHEFHVICFDRHSGKTLWDKVATTQVPNEGTHPDNNFASSTPTTDGNFLYVPFGSQGYYCFDLEGNLVWKRDLGAVRTRVSFGEGSSLVLHGSRLIIVRDNEGQSAIYALDTKTGKTVWKRDRDEPTSWATPIVVRAAGKTQVITNASNFVRSYDLETGELIWKCSGQVSNVTPSPLQFGDTVICMSGYRGQIAMAIKLDSVGDVSNEPRQIVWKITRGTPYIPSGTIYDDHLYFTQSNMGILSTVHAGTGKPIYDRTRIDGINSMYASLVGANGRIYCQDRRGTVTVLKHGNQFEIEATNKLDDDFDATPVPVGNQLFLRGKRYLYCIQSE